MESKNVKTEIHPAGIETVNASPVILSKDIFKGSRTVLIQHRNQQYRLQLTKAGKLILIK